MLLSFPECHLLIDLIAGSLVLVWDGKRGSVCVWKSLFCHWLIDRLWQPDISSNSDLFALGSGVCVCVCKLWQDDAGLIFDIRVLSHLLIH